MDKNSMPYSLEAEQALLGCMCMENEILSNVLESVEENDFYVEAHVCIFNAVKLVYHARKPVDIVTLSDALENSGQLERAGGLEYLVELTQSVPSTANYAYYLGIVRRDGINRRLMRVGREIADHARKSDDATESIRYAEAQLYAVSKTQDTSTFRSVKSGEGLALVLEKFQKLAEDRNAYRGVMTGINRFDRLTNGLQKTNLIVLAARPGMGKTSLAMNIVERAAVVDGKVCAVFSLEMSETEILQRLVCSTAKVSMSAAMSGKLNVDDWKRIAAASVKIENSDIVIDDSSLVTPAEIMSKCRRIKSQHNGRLDLIMIDYIQLMLSGDNRKTDNRAQEVAAITRDLKIMAKELNVPVLALSQLKRQTGEPQLSDLRESGAIEQDADIVMFINRPDVAATEDEMLRKGIERGAAVLNVAKNRHGGLERIPLKFRGELTKFVNPEYDEETEARAEKNSNF